MNRWEGRGWEKGQVGASRRSSCLGMQSRVRSLHAPPGSGHCAEHCERRLPTAAAGSAAAAGCGSRRAAAAMITALTESSARIATASVLPSSRMTLGLRGVPVSSPTRWGLAPAAGRAEASAGWGRGS